MMNKFTREVQRAGKRQIKEIDLAVDIVAHLFERDGSIRGDAKRQLKQVNTVLIAQKALMTMHLRKLAEQKFICSGLVGHQ